VSACGGPARYEIRVAGVLDGRWAAWFDGLQISGQGEETVICGLVADQPALHGLLTKVRDLGLCLISVRRLDTGLCPAPSGQQARGGALGGPAATATTSRPSPNARPDKSYQQVWRKT
jgi:hypothetical protein